VPFPLSAISMQTLLSLKRVRIRISPFTLENTWLSWFGLHRGKTGLLRFKKRGDVFFRWIV